MPKPERYEEVCEHFHRLSEIEPAQRAADLEALRRRDAQLAQAVEAMMKADELAGRIDFLASDKEFGETSTFAGNRRDEQDSQLAVGSAIRHYEIRDVLDKGGMGVVYRAYDQESERFVALKTIKTDGSPAVDEVERFRAEVKAAAQLDHPNLVPMYEAGHANGWDYFTMALVEGSNLHTLVRSEQVSPRQAAQWIAKLSRAVAYAHEKRIVHRDIKPKNVLIDPTGEPRLADFGIARRLHAENANEDATAAGTISYMAPEQFNDPGNVDERADVHGLGATLYHCLTGEPPFATLQDVLGKTPCPPSQGRPEIHAYLSSICMKCLEKDPNRRYGSAAELAVDLERFLVDEPPRYAQLPAAQPFRQVLNYQLPHGSLESAGATIWIGLMTLILHPTVLLITWTNQHAAYLWVTLIAWAAAASWVAYYYHWRNYWKLLPFERQSGTIQQVTHLCYACLFLIHGPLTADAPVTDFLGVYPPYSLVVAIALCGHASIHAGRWLLYGGLFIPLALVISLQPAWGPLIFCAAMTLTAIDIQRTLQNSAK